MGTFLFDQIVFGPVQSRRLGVSLGINLLPVNKKICTFNCLYCECGWTKSEIDKSSFHSSREVKAALEEKLREMAEDNERPDAITFAGNGEPTLHPAFEEIMGDTLRLRDQWCPSAEIAVLSNATMIGNPPVFRALLRADKNILKLDSGIQETINLINQPKVPYNLEETIQSLTRFEGNMVIQTLFLRGSYHGQPIDNTTEKEIQAWIDALNRIQPGELMIYTLSRETPAPDLETVSEEELQKIAERVEQELNIEVHVAA